MKALLITGTRNLTANSEWDLQEWLCRQEYDILLHGGAMGTDSVAAVLAHEMGKQVVEIKPNYARYSAKAAPVMRNAELVKEAAKRGARVVAWQPHGKTNGTQDTIKRAMSAGLMVEEYRGNGEWLTHEAKQLQLL